MTSWIELFTALIGLLAAFRVLSPAWKWCAKKRRHSQTVAGMIQLRSIHDSLEKIRLYGADRVIVFAGHNSGGVPRPGSSFYVSALHWSANKASSEVIPGYKDLPVDGHYIDMLLKCEQFGKYRFEPDSAPKCQLKEYYEFEGVVDSFVFFLALTDGNFLYLSVAKKGEKFEDHQMVPIELEVQAIRNVVR